MDEEIDLSGGNESFKLPLWAVVLITLFIGFGGGYLYATNYSGPNTAETAQQNQQQSDKSADRGDSDDQLEETEDIEESESPRMVYMTQTEFGRAGPEGPEGNGYSYRVKTIDLASGSEKDLYQFNYTYREQDGWPFAFLNAQDQIVIMKRQEGPGDALILSPAGEIITEKHLPFQADYRRSGNEEVNSENKLAFYDLENHEIGVIDIEAGTRESYAISNPPEGLQTDLALLSPNFWTENDELVMGLEVEGGTSWWKPFIFDFSNTLQEPQLALEGIDLGGRGQSQRGAPLDRHKTELNHTDFSKEENQFLTPVSPNISFPIVDRRPPSYLVAFDFDDYTSQVYESSEEKFFESSAISENGEWMAYKEYDSSDNAHRIVFSPVSEASADRTIIKEEFGISGVWRIEWVSNNGRYAIWVDASNDGQTQYQYYDAESGEVSTLLSTPDGLSSLAFSAFIE